ncbi:MAG: aspartate aminotransferase family protein [Candidatus Bathyarchaeia archaeon]
MFENYISKTSSSRAFYERAKKVLPAGVSYSIRYFEPYPFYVARAKGSRVYDVDGNEYVDFWLGHTALILGHSPSAVVRAVKRQVEKGTHYGASHELEIALAEQVAKMVPSVEMVRFTNSGTEANMYAVRLARAYTGERKIGKFEGGWHGGYDALHIAVKPPYDMLESAGLTPGAVQDTIILPNNIEGVREKIKHERIAAIIVEPVLGAGGTVPAEREFLRGLREICDEKDALLIVDEVITGFRLAPGGVEQYFGVRPDITVFGKILGGGFPIGAFCGPDEIMVRLDHTRYERSQFCFHGGTFTANPVTMTAGLTTLKILEDGVLINRLNNLGEKLRRNLREVFESYKVDVQVTGTGSLFCVHFTKETVKDANASFRADRRKLLDYHLKLIESGVFFLPTHSGALCAAHKQKDIEKLLSTTEVYAKGLN